MTDKELLELAGLGSTNLLGTGPERKDMKAELDENGVMMLTSESATEAYALKHWVEAALIDVSPPLRTESCLWRGSMLMTNTTVPNAEITGRTLAQKETHE